MSSRIISFVESKPFMGQSRKPKVEFTTHIEPLEIGMIVELLLDVVLLIRLENRIVMVEMRPAFLLL